MFILQVFYAGINPEGNILQSFIIKVDSSIESSYTWHGLTQGRHQFNVVAFTNKGPGEAASLMLCTLPNNGM